MNANLTAPLQRCARCNDYIRAALYWIDGKPYHYMCHPSAWGMSPAPDKPLTEADVRRIVREELDKRFDSTGVPR